MIKKLLLAICLFGPAAGFAATLKVATVAPDGTVWMKKLRQAGADVAEQTDGRVKFKFYPGGVMGDAATVRRKMRIGQLHGGAFTGGELAEVHSDYFLYSLPFLFKDQSEVDAVRPQLDPILADGLRSKGLELLGIAGGGFVYMMSDHPLRNAADLAQAKVWVPDNDPLSEQALRRSGVAPIPLPLSDVYTALQTGAIDTAMNTEVGAIAFQWHTKIKHVVDLPVAFVVGALALDRRRFDKIDAADQLLVKKIFGETFAELEQINQDDNVGARAALIKQGVEFTSMTEDEAVEWHKVGDRTVADLRSDNRFELTQLEFLLQQLSKHREQASQAQVGAQ